MQYVRVAIAFLVSYAILYGLSVLGLLGAWNSVMYYSMPVAGFFFGYWCCAWIQKEWNVDWSLKPWIPIVWLAVSAASFYAALLFYVQNNAWLTLRSQGSSKLLLESFTEAAAFVNQNFFSTYWESAFLPFSIALLLGWLAYGIIQKLSKS